MTQKHYFVPHDKTDVIFVDIDKNEYHVHSIMLINRCGEVFNDIQLDACENLHIQVNYQSHIVHLFLKYIYDSSTLLYFPKNEDWLDFLKICVQFNGPTLKCFEYISNNITLFKLVELQNIALQIKAPQLQIILKRRQLQENEKLCKEEREKYVRNWNPDTSLEEWKVGDCCESITMGNFPRSYIRLPSQIVEMDGKQNYFIEFLSTIGKTHTREWVTQKSLVRRGTFVAHFGTDDYNKKNPWPELHTQSCVDTRSFFHMCTCNFIISKLHVDL